MTIITYQNKDLLNESLLNSLRKQLDKLYVKEIISGYTVNKDVLTIHFIENNPNVLFQSGIMIGLAYAIALTKI